MHLFFCCVTQSFDFHLYLDDPSISLLVCLVRFYLLVSTSISVKSNQESNMSVVCNERTFPQSSQRSACLSQRSCSCIHSLIDLADIVEESTLVHCQTRQGHAEWNNICVTLSRPPPLSVSPTDSVSGLCQVLYWWFVVYWDLATMLLAAGPWNIGHRTATGPPRV